MHFDFAEKRFVLEAIVSGSAMSKCGTFFYPNVYVRIAATEIMSWICQESDIDCTPTAGVQARVVLFR